MTRNKIEIEVQRKMVKEMFTSQRDRYRIQVVQDIKDAVKIIGESEGYDFILEKNFLVPGEWSPVFILARKAWISLNLS